MNKKILAQKSETVSALQDKCKRAKSVVLIDYKGLNVLQDTELRNNFRKANVEYKVVKNTILVKVFEGLEIKCLGDSLKGPTSVAISYDDVIAPAKIAAESGAKLESLKIKAGIAEGKVMSAAEVGALAKIPAKEVLIGQLLGLLTNPMRSLAVALSEIAKKKTV